MAWLRKQPKVAPPLREIRPALAKPIIHAPANSIIHESISALFPPALQPARRPALQPARPPVLQPAQMPALEPTQPPALQLARPPALQLARPPIRLPSQPPTRRRFNNESRDNNQSHLSLSALEEEYTEHIQAEAAFPPDIDDINVHSSVLRYQSYIDSIIKRLK